MSEIAVAVAVPVRNEVRRLPRLLAALADQRSAARFAVFLFLDNCDDGSEALVTALAPRLPYPVYTDCCDSGGSPNAGLARRRALQAALEIMPDAILMTTDADGEPAPGWIAANLAALADADIVLGRVIRGLGPASPMQDRLGAYLDRLHAVRRMLDPVPWEAGLTHHWTSAASLALPASVYQALGGFPALANGEDAALVDAAARAGLRVRRDPAAVVRTSARRQGRAERGFAAMLAAFDRLESPPTVAHPEDEAWRFAMQADARRRHGSGRYAGLASALHLPLAEVEQVAAECRNGEAFAARIVGAPPGGMRSVTLCHAEASVTGIEHARLRGAA